MQPDGPEAPASVEQVKAWKRHRTGPKPPFRAYRAYYRAMRWGPFSYWTWRNIAALLGSALILYAVLSFLWSPLRWFLPP